MANLKQRLHRKNAAGSYDVIYLETGADLVKRADGVKSVESSLTEIEAWNPLKYEEISGEPMAPFNIITDADTLQGHPASDFVLADTSDKPVIPAVGEIVEWKGYTWRVVHDDGKLAYLMMDAILENIAYSDLSYSNGYLGSKLYQRCLKFAADKDITNCGFVADIMGGKVFIAGADQMNGQFSYFNSNSRRIAKLNGTAAIYWTSSPRSGSDYAYYVTTNGSIDYGHNVTNTLGFRPCVAVIK